MKTNRVYRNLGFWSGGASEVELPDYTGELRSGSRDMVAYCGVGDNYKDSH